MIEIEIRGLDRAISIFERAFSDKQKLLMMRALAIRVERQTKKRINTEKTNPDGSAWAALAASTIAAKGHGDILINTRNLVSSIQHFESSSSAEIGSSVFYGKFQQEGAYNVRSKKNLPIRAFMGVSDANAQELETICANFIAARFNGSVLGLSLV